MGLFNVRFGSLADICSAISHVRFTPESGTFMNATACLPSKLFFTRQRALGWWLQLPRPVRGWRRWLRRAAQLSCSSFGFRGCWPAGACRSFRDTPTAKQMASSASRPIKSLIMISHPRYRLRHCILHDPRMCSYFTSRRTELAPVVGEKTD
jgi:hypothetical protein